MRVWGLGCGVRRTPPSPRSLRPRDPGRGGGHTSLAGFARGKREGGGGREGKQITKYQKGEGGEGFQRGGWNEVSWEEGEGVTPPSPNEMLEGRHVLPLAVNQAKHKSDKGRGYCSEGWERETLIKTHTTD